MREKLWTMGLLLILMPGQAFAELNSPSRSAQEILKSYVADFRSDPQAAKAGTVGIRVTGEGGGDWHVVAAGRKNDAGQWDVTLHPGLPPEPTAYYVLDLNTLRKLDRGEMSALTAMGRAQWNDPVPMDVRFMEGFKPGPEFMAQGVVFTFHFWTRGFPEVVPFGREHSRLVHGGNAVIFYYQKGLRSGWYQIEKGQHINQDPKDQVNEFPTLLVVIRGAGRARIGGQEMSMETGQAILIPAGVAHEFWNTHDEPVEFIIVMFGAGA